MNDMPEDSGVRTLKPYLSFFAATKAKRGVLTPAIRGKIGDLKEIANICERLFGRRPEGHTVKSVLGESAIPRKRVRRFPPYHGAEDIRESREAVVTLHHEAWQSFIETNFNLKRRLADHFVAETREETPRGTAPTREGKTGGAAPRRFSVP